MSARGATVEELEAVYRRELAQLVRAARAIVGDEGLAQDAVHDAFVNAVRARASFRGDSTLEGWVWRIVVNAATQMSRSRRDEPVGEQEIESSDYGLDTVDLTVRRWVATLPERQRLAVFLRYFADLDYRTIAFALEVEIGTVSATLGAAHAALRRALQGVKT